MEASGPTEFGYQVAFLKGSGSGCRPAHMAMQVCTKGSINSKQMPQFTSVLSFPVCSKNYNRCVPWQDACIWAKIASSVQFAAIRFNTVRWGTWLLSRWLVAGVTKAPSHWEWKVDGVWWGGEEKNEICHFIKRMKTVCRWKTIVQHLHIEQTKCPFFWGSWAWDISGPYVKSLANGTERGYLCRPTLRHPHPRASTACHSPGLDRRLVCSEHGIWCQKYKVSQCGPLVKNLLNAHLFIHLPNVHQVPTLCYATCLTQE